MPASAEPATGPQKKFMRDLARVRAIYGLGVSYDETQTRLEADIAAGISKADASANLDEWQHAPFFPPASRRAQPYQVDRLRALAEERAIYGLAFTPDETVAKVEEKIAGGMTEAEARDFIRQAAGAQRHPNARSPLPLSVIEGIEDLPVPEGNFAVLLDDVLRFYRIYTPGTGALAGQTVIRRMASTSQIALYPDEARAALTAIHADPDTAAFRYSDEFTECWVCGKPLTDPVSRLVSVGPVCRGFDGDSGLKAAAAAVDRDASRRAVFRALRKWALDQGYLDPRNREDRVSMKGAVTASRLASAWSGVPGFIHFPPDSAVVLVQRAIAGDMDELVGHSLLIAPADTVLILIESGVLSAPVLNVLMRHPATQVREAAAEVFLTALGNVSRGR